MKTPFLARETRRSGACTIALVLIVVGACTEPNRGVQTRAEPAPLSARLELSDSLAATGEVLVTVRLLGKTTGSMTARLTYDSTALAFLREEPLPDAATRIINPASGLVRFAAIAPQGFMQGRAYVMRFAVRRAGALQTLRLVVDEVHALSPADVPAALPSRNP